MKEIRLAKKIIKTLIKDRILYPGRVLTEMVSLIARCGLLLILYAYVFKLNGGSINGLPYNIAAWSMFLYFGFYTLRLGSIARLIMQDVQSGNVEVLFNKPVSYLGYRIWWQIGSGLFPFLVAMTFGSLALVALVGIPETMQLPIFLPTVTLVFVLAIILSLLVYGIVGLLAFWVEDTNPIFWMVDKAVMILGGSYLPVAMFPPFLYKLSLYSPFGASQFMTHTVYEGWQLEWLSLVGIQIFWIIALTIVMALLFNKARAKVSVNGG